MQAVLQKIRLYTDLVKFEHTVFALPFALSSLLLASGSTWPPFATVVWVIFAMVGGRTYAMGLNRIIDVAIDGQNPRTQNRALPAGRVRLLEAWLLTVFALMLMVFAVLHLPPLCLYLLPVAWLILTAYSYIKRFSNMAHLVLGLALGSSAIGGWVALTGQVILPALLFGLAVLFWVAGFDILYACQDVDFDRKAGLYSIPASWGIETGLRLSRMFHGGTVVALILVGCFIPTVGIFYWLGVVLACIMLFYEQSLVKAHDLTRLNEAFFNINGIMSLGFLLCVFLDKLLHLRWSG